MAYKHIEIPEDGEQITITDSGDLNVPLNPIIPFIEGDGIGTDVTAAMIRVVDHAVNLAYNGERKIAWMEVFCGEKSLGVYGENEWLPDETIHALEKYVMFTLFKNTVCFLGLNRKNIIDNRVHCCFYFINPYGHGLKPLDIEVSARPLINLKYLSILLKEALISAQCILYL